MDKKVAKLVAISRGFAGDNATYKSCDGEIIVCVGWALLAPYVTTVLVNNEEVARFDDREYIQPHVALARLGYDVSGAVDFAASTSIDNYSSRVPMVRVTHEALTSIAIQVIAMVLKKNKDYGDAWQRHGGAGWAMKLADKLCRIETLANDQEALVLNEDIEDSLRDAIGYSLLGLLWLRENKPGE